tara:strand:+ start:1356 stop:1478 length:123 start_codon:yes stop_codon:yes gene_type:complete
MLNKQYVDLSTFNLGQDPEGNMKVTQKNIHMDIGKYIVLV